MKMMKSIDLIMVPRLVHEEVADIGSTALSNSTRDSLYREYLNYHTTSAYLPYFFSRLRQVRLLSNILVIPLAKKRTKVQDTRYKVLQVT